ncbi:glycosyltransferase family 2 protein [Algoriphagus vanfongensis]|uniref:glycosyltransferase family 2 protein n=1 Tax=Algoriphagus vanfongensis TaxID=426371 RepID=UPI00047B5AAB|nr:glycosyltransferase [Algoriphagus vanfongensis]
MAKQNSVQKMKLIDLAPFERVSNYSLSGIHDISILIKTLEREAHLIQLLASIQKYGFQGPILIADDSKVPYGKSVKAKFPYLNIQYLELPYDTGTAEGRNEMLKLVDTPYFLLCDDDFVFDRRSRIPLMKKYLIDYHLDVLGGVFIQYKRRGRTREFFNNVNALLMKFDWFLPSYQKYDYYANFYIDSRVIYFKKKPFIEPVTACDLTHNFFLARTDKVLDFGGWNPILKGGEHQNFFIRAKLAGLKIGTTRTCGVIHDQWTPNSELYKSLRNRGDFYKKIALQEFNIIEVRGYKEALGEDFFSK